MSSHQLVLNLYNQEWSVVNWLVTLLKLIDGNWLAVSLLFPLQTDIGKCHDNFIGYGVFSKDHRNTIPFKIMNALSRFRPIRFFMWVVVLEFRNSLCLLFFKQKIGPGLYKSKRLFLLAPAAQRKTQRSEPYFSMPLYQWILWGINPIQDSMSTENELNTIALAPQWLSKYPEKLKNYTIYLACNIVKRVL